MTLWVLVHFECWFADLAEADDSSLSRAFNSTALSRGGRTLLYDSDRLLMFS